MSRWIIDLRHPQVTFAISRRIRGLFLARKILLADDSVTAQNMGRKILTDAGYEVIAVNNGSAALKKIAEHKPDLAILDVYMPGYSGLEVCQRLKENPDSARIPVLLSVGKLEPFKPEEAQRVRAEGYIVKPFEASELLALCRNWKTKWCRAPNLPSPAVLPAPLRRRNSPSAARARAKTMARTKIRTATRPPDGRAVSASLPRSPRKKKNFPTILLTTTP